MKSRVDLWRGLLIICVIVASFSLGSLPSLFRDISGDSIPNRPQQGPPIEYQWGVAISRVIMAILSIVLGAYSWRRISLS